MKKKELKKLAKRIAEAEYIIHMNSNEAEVEWAKEVILSISHDYAIDFEEMTELDELVQDILLKEYNVSNFD